MLLQRGPPPQGEAAFPPPPDLVDVGTTWCSWQKQWPPTRTGDADRGAVHSLGVEASIIRLAPFISSRGTGKPLVDDITIHPPRFTVDSPQALDAIQDFLDLGTHNPPIPDDRDMEAQDLSRGT